MKLEAKLRGGPEPPDAGGSEGLSLRERVAARLTLILNFWPPELRENKYRDRNPKEPTWPCSLL